MKKILSVILTLTMLVGLVGVLGVTALADGDGVTIVVTGGTGGAVGGEGLGFSAAAALKGSYDDNAVMLVDAGGFNVGAAAIMTAAGYDLIVPEEALNDWDINSISMGVSGLSAGVMFEKNGVKVAFVGVVPMADLDDDTYYANIQAAVTAALDKGAEHVVALGLVEDASTLLDVVSGIDIVLTYGDEADVTEITAEDDETQVLATVLTVGAGFDTIGLLTVNDEGVKAENLDAEAYEALGLEESDVIQALESAFKVVDEEEQPEEENSDADQTEEISADEEDALQDGDTEEQSEENSEENAEENTEEQSEENSEENTEEQSEEKTEENTEEQSEENTEENTEEQSEENAQGTEEKTEDAPVLPTPAAVVDDASPEDAVDETKQGEESAAVDGEAESKDSASDLLSTDGETETKSYTRGETDLSITFEKAVSKIDVDYGAAGLKTFGDSYYTLSDEGKTVAIKHDVINPWVDGNYTFRFTFSDNTTQDVIVNISGNYTAPATATTTTTATSTPEPTPTPAPTASPAPRGNTPATGDNSPILTYIIILVVLAVALVVVIVLVARKGKKGGTKH